MLAGRSAGGATTAEHDRPTAGRIDAAERGRDERDERRRRRVIDGVGIESGLHGQPGAGVQRSRHDRQAADVGEREARQPVVVGVDLEPALVALG